MTEREAQIRFERQLENILSQYQNGFKLNSDTIFFYINKAKEEYIKQLYRVFQQNQEMSDKLRTLVVTKTYYAKDMKNYNNKFVMNYPEDYMFALGEQTFITIKNNQCPNLTTKSSDVIEATIETVDRILENSLSEYHLRHNNAKPVRVYTDNNIVLYTDNKYGIDTYKLTYLKKSYDLGKNIKSEYTDLQDFVLNEIVDVAVDMYVRHVTATSSNDQKQSKE